MKKILSAAIMTATIMGVADAKTLVAYYSRTGNTQQFAEMIAGATGGDMYRIELVDENHYPTDYNKMTEFAKQEIANGTFPEIKSIPDITEYDVVFIGTPVWHGTMASPVRAFLKNIDVAGKSVIPFSTHGGGGVGTSLLDIAANAARSGHRDGLSLPGADVANATPDIQEWLTEINVIEK